MRILLLGYGKMGKTIETVALGRGHQIVGRWGKAELADMKIPQGMADVAIEFTAPDSAPAHLRACLLAGIPVVCGSTGWLAHKPEIDALCRQQGGALFYASNFSVGVHLFFHLNRLFARWMATQPQYQVSLKEIHHTQKKDAPSGTAITLAEHILSGYPAKTHWTAESPENPQALHIASIRTEGVPGTHEVLYASAIDQIELIHTAHSREGFAMGAVLAAEWLKDRPGVWGMDDLLEIPKQ